MPADWSRPVDVERLADAGERRENDLPLASLPRLAPDLAIAEGTVHARIEFARERKQPVADIEVRARLPLRCQRCMQPMWLDVDQQSRVWLVSDPRKNCCSQCRWCRDMRTNRIAQPVRPSPRKKKSCRDRSQGSVSS
jgi:uncharacterized metal-binding protein YceD (DUF177 family)